ncbi:hypothetical protein NNJEOMEG_00244 [Fundidesulfovibrio magnetotacticus]|uniref:Epoxyqueuosine reductase QueH n=1 Tax=Fundidesulfovibrio magnetotacticus TaxID=2730080 RepID=A0A6V8LQK7_9BACT|nr:epoxyqueuosine reductase QueH [Fundidesulfovibrio magnetotacticus]GFK92419.1 hypothetical protein NNJEOMEG_00244 [Fundidesulfovibrio magnetotacticus]
MLLVHACCGPCSITVFTGLMERGLSPRGFFHNPNIHPLGEYLRRAEALEQVAARLGTPVDFDHSGHDPASFLRLTTFREKERCPLCHALRLERTAREARRLGAGAFTTTLLYSRYQDHEAIRAAGEEAARVHGVPFHYEDFRPGWDEGQRLAREWGLYRQPYCGCVHSEFERYVKKLRRLPLSAGYPGAGPACGGVNPR